MLQIIPFVKLDFFKILYISESDKKIINKETRYGIFSIGKSEKFIDFAKKLFTIPTSWYSKPNSISICSNECYPKEYRGCSSDESYEDDADYIYYEQLDEQLQTEKDLLDSQITELDSQISSMKTLVQNNIKSSCTLNLSGGN